MRPLPLHEVVDRAAPAPLRQAPALVAEGVTTTFACLAERLRRAASLVAELTDPGDRVGIIGDNHHAWVDAYYGVPAAGRILVFLNHRLAASEVRSISDRAGLRAVIGAGEHLERVGLDVPAVTFADWDDELSRRPSRRT